MDIIEKLLDEIKHNAPTQETMQEAIRTISKLRNEVKELKIQLDIEINKDLD